MNTSVYETTVALRALATTEEIINIKVRANSKFLGALAERVPIAGGKFEDRIYFSFWINTEMALERRKFLIIMSDVDMDAYETYDDVQYMGRVELNNGSFRRSYYLFELFGG